MGLTPNPRLILAKNTFHELPVPGEHILLNGRFLTKTLLLRQAQPLPRVSLLVLNIRTCDPSIISYLTAMKVGQALTGFGLDGVKVGDYLYGFTTWEAYLARVELRREDPQYTIDMDSLYLRRVPDPEGAFPWTKYVGCLGTPGLTAFIGLERVAEAKPGQTIYVSSGASGVGRCVCPMFFNSNCTQTASGSKYDVAFNYKTIPVAAALQEHGPIDLFWDNVGGAQLEAALENMNMKGRVICCGAIAEYNIPADERYGAQNMSTMFHRRIRLEGCVVADTPECNARFFSEIPPLIAEGRIKAQEQLFAGLESGPEAVLSLLSL
ncbi:hypothetical protein B0H14DRAFT_2919724 [Mycena olivaceomarginata]|nr:hypothetical protein B0H14DRAFT_2919724 [Mycena olivaceomarginata]